MNMASFFQSPSSTSPLEVRQQQKAIQVSDQNNKLASLGAYQLVRYLPI